MNSGLRILGVYLVGFYSCCSSYLSNAGTNECDQSYMKQTALAQFSGKSHVQALCAFVQVPLWNCTGISILPSCFNFDCFPGRTKLRSATAGLLVVPFVPSKTIDSNRSFAYCAPVAWNHLHKLSPGLCNPTVSLATFKKHLKTFLFVNNNVLLNSTRWQYLLFFLRWHSLHSPLWC